MACRMSGSGQNAILDVQELSADPSGCPGVVGRLSIMSLSGPEAHPDVREPLPDVW